MKLITDAQIKQVAKFCKRFDDLDIDACCEDRRYLVDAKSVGGMRLLKNGGEVYFKMYGGSKQSRTEFVEGLSELSKTI